MGLTVKSLPSLTYHPHNKKQKTKDKGVDVDVCDATLVLWDPTKHLDAVF